MRQAGGNPFVQRHWPLLLALGLGVMVRLALWGQLPRLGLISDEAEYLAAADWLAQGRGFAWHTQYLWTRAPLYPLFLAGHVTLFGRVLEPIFVTQTALSLLNVVLTYILARQITADRPFLRGASGIAALLAALYLPLASYTQLLLSETLFVTLLLGALVMLGQWGRLEREGHEVAKGTNANGAKSIGTLRGRLRGLAPWLWLAGAGVLLGLATLTRGLTLGFLPVVAVWLVVTAKRMHPKAWKRHTALAFCILHSAFCILVAPWSLYATRAYGGVVIVDTTGAFNLALGARTAYDGGRSDEPTRSLVLALLDPRLNLDERRALLTERRGPDGAVVRAGACLYTTSDPRLLAALERVPELTQADRQRLLSAEALCLLRARPLAFVTKSLTELVDLFKINYTGDERLSKGFALGRLPPWYVAALFLLDDTLYVLALPLTVLGWAALSMYKAQGTRHNFPTTPIAALVGLWLLYNIAAAPLLFAINRFRVPLMPLSFVLAGVALAQLLRAPGGNSQAMAGKRRSPLILAGARANLGVMLRQPYGVACAVLSGLLLLVAAAPYAYLEPRKPGEDSRWASYLGPYPSSLASTGRALASREGYLREQRLGAALGAGDAATARVLLADPALPPYAAAVGAPLLDGLEGRPAAGLDRLATQPTRPLEPWQTALVAGELFRQMGDLEAARRELNPPIVDNENPVGWAWHWLYPPKLPHDRIELADDNDLGYINGFYLGRYDEDLGATTRWATGEAALRFPAAATGAPQQLCLRASGLGWPTDLPLPEVRVALDAIPLGSFALTRSLETVCLPLPARPTGADLFITLRAPTFVPDALDLIAQQGPQVGQLRLLAFQLDWAEVRRKDEG